MALEAAGVQFIPADAKNGPGVRLSRTAQRRQKVTADRRKATSNSCPATEAWLIRDSRNEPNCGLQHSLLRKGTRGHDLPLVAFRLSLICPRYAAAELQLI